MKRTLIAIVIVTPIILPVNAHAQAGPGIPVFDSSNILVWTAELAKWKDQIQQATEAVRVGTDTYNALTGITSLEDVIKSDLLWQFLPDNYMAVYEQGIKIGLGGLFTEAWGLYDAALDHDVCKYAGESAAKNCYGRQVAGYNLMATSKQVFRNAERRQQQIDRTREKAKLIQTPKERETLQTAVNTEIASAQVELLTLQSMEMARLANEEMLEQTRSQEAYKVYDITEPVVFDDYVPGSLTR